MESQKSKLGGFHKFVIVYIMVAVVLQFIGCLARAVVGPATMLENGSSHILIRLSEHYRLLLYAFADLMVGLALLYLFYSQGQLLLTRRHSTKLPFS